MRSSSRIYLVLVEWLESKVLPDEGKNPNYVALFWEAWSQELNSD